MSRDKNTSGAKHESRQNTNVGKLVAGDGDVVLTCRFVCVDVVTI